MMKQSTLPGGKMYEVSELEILKDQVEALEVAMTLVPEKDRVFASSLVSTYKKYKGLSPKQAPWVQTLLSRALNIAPPQVTESVGNFDAVYSLFAKAKQQIKFPKIRLQLYGQPVVLALAGAKSKVPGVVNVTDGRPFGQNRWYGRVDQEGNWSKPAALYNESPDVEKLLKALADDPVDTVGKYGKLTGSCAFCNLQLKDAQSVAAGYGPQCAINFGLSAQYKAAKPVTL